MSEITTGKVKKSLTLDSSLVQQLETLAEKNGTKLSPLIASILEESLHARSTDPEATPEVQVTAPTGMSVERRMFLIQSAMILNMKEQIGPEETNRIWSEAQQRVKDCFDVS